MYDHVSPDDSKCIATVARAYTVRAGLDTMDRVLEGYICLSGCLRPFQVRHRQDPKVSGQRISLSGRKSECFDNGLQDTHRGGRLGFYMLPLAYTQAANSYGFNCKEQ
jgi:hypothetical protein